MPARKSTPSESAAETLNPPPEEPVPYISRADAEGLVAPQPVPPGDDQVEITLPDGTVAVVDKVFAEALDAAKGKSTASVKQFPPGYEPEPTRPGGPPAAAPDTSVSQSGATTEKPTTES